MNINDYLWENYDDSISEKERTHIIAYYEVISQQPEKAAEAIAIGQSIGNPSVRVSEETEDMYMDHLAKIVDFIFPEHMDGSMSGLIVVAYPMSNFNPKEDGLGQLLCMLMGGQMDIDLIQKCRLIDVDFPKAVTNEYLGPRFGMDEIKKMCDAEKRPLLGGIVKPKTGMTAGELADCVAEMALGGCDFIKEDEILGNLKTCQYEKRIETVVSKLTKIECQTGHRILYVPNANSRLGSILDRVIIAHRLGAGGVHINVWNGFPDIYDAVRRLDLPIAIHFQKSGDKCFTDTNHRFGIDWPVVCKLARMAGADFIHAGMFGGYMNDNEVELDDAMWELRSKVGPFKRTVPSLSCGAHPGLVAKIVRNFGDELMISAGGAMHGHPSGTKAGALAFRQEFDRLNDGHGVEDWGKTHPEFKAAIDKWGYQK